MPKESPIPTPRIRGPELQRLRDEVLADEPLCRPCANATPPRTTLASQIDHIVPLYKGGAEHRSNRQPICDACHARKTDADLNRRHKPPVALDGWTEQPDARTTRHAPPDDYAEPASAKAHRTAGIVIA